MKHFVTINDAWLYTLNQLSIASTHSPRNIPTQEILGHGMAISMIQPIMTLLPRKLSYEFMFAEAMWILTGDNRLDTLVKYAPSYSKFSDDGIYLKGAYGPKLVSQFEGVRHALVNDKDTRQAVMTFWIRNPSYSKDIPCTISVQYLIRNNKLVAIHTMRSSDAWLGLPYDFFSFVMVATAMCITLRDKYPYLDLGEMYFTAGSQHIYHKNLSAAMAILQTKGRISSWFCPVLNPSDFHSVPHLIEELTYMKDKIYKGITSNFFMGVATEMGRSNV